MQSLVLSVTSTSQKRHWASAHDITAKEVALLIVAIAKNTSLALGQDHVAHTVARGLLEGIFFADLGSVARQAHSCYQ